MQNHEKLEFNLSSSYVLVNEKLKV